MGKVTRAAVSGSVLRPVIFAGALFLAVGMLFWYTQHRAFTEHQRHLLLDVTNTLARVQLHLDSHRDYLQLLAAEMVHRTLDAGSFRSRTSQYVADHPELLRITWADADFVVPQTAPFEPHKQGVGLQLPLSEPQRISRLAYETRRPIYTRPFVATQGQTAFAIYVPVFRGDTFLGTLGGVYSIAKILRQALTSSVVDRYQLKLFNDTKAVFVSDGNERHVDPRLTHRVSLTPSGQGLVLQFARYKIGQEWGTLGLGLLVAGLAFGLVWGLWGLKHQIVERDTTAENALRPQGDWVDVTLSSIGEAVIAIDTNGVITFINRAAEMLTEWPASEAVGRCFNEVFCLIDEQSRQPLACPLSHVLANGAIGGFTNHTMLVTRQGREVPIAETGVPIHDSNRGSHGVVWVFRDITESKRLKTQVRQAQKMQAIGTLAGRIAHEFNNLLAAILGYTELTQYEVPQGSKAWENSQAVLSAGRHAKDLVQQILAFSRQSEPELVPMPFHLVMQEALALVRATLPASLELRARVEADVGEVLADRTQLHQIVINLCANAEHAMRKTGGILEVRVDVVAVKKPPSSIANLRPGAYVCLTVRDTGHGMAPSVLEHIFEPFFTTKDSGEGTGMGLAIVHSIVLSHGGAITTESTPGQGSMFTVYLPQIRATVDASADICAPLPCLADFPLSRL